MTSMPASRNARAITLAPRSWPSSPGLATSTRIFRSAGIWVDSTKPKIYHGDTEALRDAFLSEIPSGARDQYRHHDPLFSTAEVKPWLSAPALRTSSDPSLRSRFQKSPFSVPPCLRGRVSVFWKLQAPPQVPAGIAAIRMPVQGELLNIFRPGQGALAVLPLDGGAHA